MMLFYTFCFISNVSDSKLFSIDSILHETTQCAGSQLVIIFGNHLT